MSKTKTALQQLKRKIVPYSCWQDNDGMVWIDKEAILGMINELLSTEREQIEDAYDVGHENTASSCESWLTLDADDYFNQTFKQD